MFKLLSTAYLIELDSYL
jgi:hypothetical protein